MSAGEVETGDEFFEAYVDREEGKVEMNLWVITAVRARTAYAIRKTPYTWVKLSKTTGNYGWSPRIDGWDRRRFLADSPPDDWAKTQAAAYTKALPAVDAAIQRLTKLRAQITGQRTKQRNAKARKLKAKALRSNQGDPHG